MSNQQTCRENREYLENKLEFLKEKLQENHEAIPRCIEEINEAMDSGKLDRAYRWSRVLKTQIRFTPYFEGRIKFYEGRIARLTD